jgi:hypothetical protein
MNKMKKLRILDHATIYRNPVPNLISEYVSFPAIQALPDGSLVCMCQHGSARESADATVKIHRSEDGGITWAETGELMFPPPPPEGSWAMTTGGLGVTQEGDVLAQTVGRCIQDGERVQPTEDSTKTPLFFYRSSDGGKSWSSPVIYSPAILRSIGAGGNIATLPNGTLVAAGERGEIPEDEHDWISTTIRSTDGGISWDEPIVAQISTGIYFFDLRIAASPSGKLLATYWSHERSTDQGLNVHTAWSTDAGMTWTPPLDSGLWGQVTVAQFLSEHEVVAVTNHRREPFGIRIALSTDGGASFDENEAVELWGTVPAQTRSAPVLAPIRDLVEDPLAAYHHFTFGTPTVTLLGDGTLVAAFYVTEQAVTYVRCCRIAVE